MVVRGSNFIYRQEKIDLSEEHMFPWLAFIAPGYESFSINSMTFEYIPQAPFTEGGMLYMAIDYDAADTNAGLSI